MSVAALRETLSKLLPADRLHMDGQSRQRYQADWSWAAVAAKAANDDPSAPGAGGGDSTLMTRIWVQWGEQAVALITLGILCMVQPFVLAPLGDGFMMVLAGMVLFMIVSHM